MIPTRFLVKFILNQKDDKMILFPIKLFYKTYWYEVSMNLTYWGILKKYGIFQSEELKSIKTEYEFLKKQNRNFIKDIQSEYHLAWCCLIHSVYLGCKRKNMALTDSIMLIEKSLFESMNAESISNYITRSLDKAKDPFEFMVKTAKIKRKNFLHLHSVSQQAKTMKIPTIP